MSSLRKLTERAAVVGSTLFGELSKNTEAHFDRRATENKVFDWLLRAHQAVGGRGFSLGYVVGKGWCEAYPEVSGYILCTLRMLAQSRMSGEALKRSAECAIRATSAWLQEVQLDEGGVYGWQGQGEREGGLIFDTGQILHGATSVLQCTSGAWETSRILKLSRFLSGKLDSDGAWRQNTFWGGEAPNYYLRVTWALFRAARVMADAELREAAYSSLTFFRTRLDENGWDGLRDGAKHDPYLDILHFRAYTIQGLIECGMAADDEELLKAAERALEHLAQEFHKHKRLPGRVNAARIGDFRWRCLTGEYQAAICFYRLGPVLNRLDFSRIGGDILESALAHCMAESAPELLRAGVWGSVPPWRDYQPWTLISWGSKFLLDALLIADADKHGIASLIRTGELA
jgi:hypothetical protein